MTKFEIYKESNRVNGCVSVEFVSCANSIEQLKEMAAEQGIDLQGYTISPVRHNIKTELGKDVKPYFRAEF